MATDNNTLPSGEIKEPKISFTDTELQSIAINAMGRSSEAGKQATTNISNFIKLFLIFLCGINFAYTSENVSGYRIFEKSSNSDDLLGRYLNNKKYVNQVYQDLDNRLNQAYKNIMNSTIYPQANKTALKNSQIAWIKAKEAECKKFSKNKDKLTNCYLDKTIDKINELWQIEANVIEKPFEGKWLSCFSFTSDELTEIYGNEICLETANVQKGNNICGTYGYWASSRYYFAITLSITKDNKNAYGIRACDMGNFNQLIGCYNVKTDDIIPFSEWSNSGEVSADIPLQYIDKKTLSVSIKTPFTQNELNELSKIQWLQDCLNYKGE